MPRRDGTGPIGKGAMTGKGFGACTDNNTVNYGMGIGCGLRRGIGRMRGFSTYNNSSKTQKQFLDNEKNLLKKRLDNITDQIDRL